MTDSSESEAKVLDVLAGLDVEYEVMECEPTLADTSDFCAHYGIPLSNSANTILVTSKSGERKFAACVLLANSRLDVNRTVRKRLGVRRISFANPEDTVAVTGMALGGVTPIGLPHDLPLWVDSRVMDAEYIILGGGSRAKKIKVTPRLFQQTPNAEIIDGLATPTPSTE